MNTTTDSSETIVVKPKVRGFFCITAHPEGCRSNVEQQIAYTEEQGLLEHGPKRVLVLGCSTGYGLATRIVSAFGAAADTLGVAYERPAEKGRTASAGWYNNAAFHDAANSRGRYARTLNGDAFSTEMKAETIAQIKKDLEQIDLVVYSLASPRRVDSATGIVYNSVLKPIGEPFTSKTVDTDKKVVQPITLEPASLEEVVATQKVMGGEDFRFWMDALLDADVLAPGAKAVAYSYIGPEVTWPIYNRGTIGLAKEDLLHTTALIDARLRSAVGGRAWVSVNKAVVTQASSAIPVVPLYLSILLRVMQEKGIDEGCIEQINRLFRNHLFTGAEPVVDELGRIRVDDWEMRSDVQSAVQTLWPEVTTETLNELTDFDRYQSEFLKLFGFGMPGIDYETPVKV
jgi:enoyl-[acyl-carrier protein] reductase / trans-2-enoyl-CoA reductase (NAD+)